MYFSQLIDYFKPSNLKIKRIKNLAFLSNAPYVTECLLYIVLKI